VAQVVFKSPGHLDFCKAFSYLGRALHIHFDLSKDDYSFYNLIPELTFAVIVQRRPLSQYIILRIFPQSFIQTSQ
jgi:hypothetical protein